jgi:hypothetical protein
MVMPSTSYDGCGVLWPRLQFPMRNWSGFRLLGKVGFIIEGGRAAACHSCALVGWEVRVSWADCGSTFSVSATVVIKQIRVRKMWARLSRALTPTPILPRYNKLFTLPLRLLSDIC